MDLEELPARAAWHHTGARSGFEVLFAESRADGHLLRGSTTAYEDGAAWSVGYVIEVDARWRTTKVTVTARTIDGDLVRRAERREGDRWWVDGAHVPELDGCIDVDLESSAVTNTLPVHRLELPVGETVSVPAAFVRADDLRFERLEQTYRRVADGPGSHNVDYASSTFDFAAPLAYDASGLIVSYPGIAQRLAEPDKS